MEVGKKVKTAQVNQSLIVHALDSTLGHKYTYTSAVTQKREKNENVRFIWPTHGFLADFPLASG